MPGQNSRCANCGEPLVLTAHGVKAWRVGLLRRLGVAIPVIVVGAFFAAIIADLVWELGLL
jgi:hypothetical protein